MPDRKIYRQGNRAGQMMLELIVSVFIILTALGGIATMVVMSVRGEERSEETVIAYNLAREGIEMMRALRDNIFTTTEAYSTCNNNCFILRNNYVDHTGVPLWDTAGPDPFTFYLSYVDSIGLYTSNSSKICQAANGLFYQWGTGCLAGDLETRFRRRIFIDYICMNPSGQECVRTSGTGCPASSGSGCPDATYTQVIGHRIRSGVHVVGRRGGDKEVIELQDYLYAWK